MGFCAGKKAQHGLFMFKFIVLADVTNREALDAFVARLHASRLDPDKPLWQYHFIFDDNSETFAIYARVHHMYGDGATLVRWFQADMYQIT